MGGTVIPLRQVETPVTVTQRMSESMIRVGLLVVRFAVVVLVLESASSIPGVAAQEAIPATVCPTTSEEANKAHVRAWYEAICSGDVKALDAFLAPEVIRHGGGTIPDALGPADIEQNFALYFAAFPDLHFEVVDLISEGDQVLSRWVLTGTFEGELLGATGDGRKIRVEGMSLDRIENGLVAEGFDGWDNYGFRKQLGVVE